MTPIIRDILQRIEIRRSARVEQLRREEVREREERRRVATQLVSEIAARRDPRARSEQQFG